MSITSADLIYQAAIASFFNPSYEARLEAEAVVGRETVGLDEFGQPLSPLKRIEKYFSLLDKKDAKKVNAQDLANAWLSRVSSPTANDLQLIAREIDRFMTQADIDRDGYVSLNEYIHYMLTLIRERDDGKRGEIHGLVAERAGGEPELVDKLIEWFVEKDKDGIGEISKNDFLDIISKIKIKDKKKLEITESIFKQDKISYSQYVLLMLGRTPTKVSLIFYDISTSATKSLSRILFGKKIEGIWHTSILAFGYEWWYGGDCFQSRPFSTPFGATPTRTEEIGETTRSLQELKEFVRSKMRKKYNYDSYDVITNNCNNFTNDVSGFLVHRGIRRSIVSLPGDLLSGGIARLMRPFLNKWLGNFKAEDSDLGSGKLDKDVLDQIRIEKATRSTEFAPGEIAMWKRSELDNVFCEILSISKDGTVKIKVFQNMHFKIKKIKNRSFLAKIPTQDLESNQTSINYLIALSILENNRSNNNDKLLMRELTNGLIDGIVTDQSRNHSFIEEHRADGLVMDNASPHFSIVNPGEETAEEQKACCSWWKTVYKKLCRTDTGGLV
jgi:Ca2+-binding EF-hand superfamily protein